MRKGACWGAGRGGLHWLAPVPRRICASSIPGRRPSGSIGSPLKGPDAQRAPGLAAATMLAGPVPAEPPQRRPDILQAMLDNVGFSDLGANMRRAMSERVG